MILKLQKLYIRSHFYVGNICRFFSTLLYQKKILIKDATTIFGASFGKDGWHHIIKTLEQYDKDPTISYKETPLYNFLKNFCPKSIYDLTDDKVCKNALPLFVYPWGTFKINESISPKDPSKSRFCGPSNNEFIKEEYDRTIALYERLKKTGYQPWSFGNGFIGGAFLCSEKGERRFVVLQGNHRMAIFAHLNYKTIEVRSVRGFLAKVSETDLPDWLLVKSGKCSSDSAKKIFSLFFKENGNHINKFLES